jgi:hypothetical protein
MPLCFIRKHATNVYVGVELDNRCRCVVGFTQPPLNSRGNSTLHALDRRLSGAHNRFGRQRKENNLQVPGIDPGPLSPQSSL